MIRDQIVYKTIDNLEISQEFIDRVKAMIRECPFCPFHIRVRLMDSAQWKEHIVEHIEARHAAHSD